MRRKQAGKMNGGGSNNNNNNRRRYRPDNNGGGYNAVGKIKSATANRDKYLNLARDAAASGDRVQSEYFHQHADHYYRVLATLQEEEPRVRTDRFQPFTEEEMAEEDRSAEGEKKYADQGTEQLDVNEKTDTIEEVAH